jgi:hypothetical protein
VSICGTRLEISDCLLARNTCDGTRIIYHTRLVKVAQFRPGAAESLPSTDGSSLTFGVRAEPPPRAGRRDDNRKLAVHPLCDERPGGVRIVQVVGLNDVPPTSFVAYVSSVAWSWMVWSAQAALLTHTLPLSRDGFCPDDEEPKGPGAFRL